MMMLLRRVVYLSQDFYSVFTSMIIPSPSTSHQHQPGNYPTLQLFALLIHSSYLQSFAICPTNGPTVSYPYPGTTFPIALTANSNPNRVSATFQSHTTPRARNQEPLPSPLVSHRQSYHPLGLVHRWHNSINPWIQIGWPPKSSPPQSSRPN
jgi:hypothetical protein